MGFLCRYLHEYGWDPYVVSCNCFGHPSKIHSHLEHDRAKVIWVDWDRKHHDTALPPRSLLKMAKRFFRPEHSDYPGLHTKTVTVADRAIRELRPSLMIASTSSLYPIPVAAALSAKFSIPWIADLRDIEEQWAMCDEALAWRLWLRRRRFTVRRNSLIGQASAVTTVADWHRQSLLRYNRRTHIICNGYDPDLFCPVNTVDDVCFRISYTGALLRREDQDPSLLFAACGRMLANGGVHRKRIAVDFYVQHAKHADLAKMAQEYGIREVVHCYDFVPIEQIPHILNRSAVLLLLSNKAEPNGPKGLTRTTKLYEYLAVQRPILCVRSDEAELEQFMGSICAGCCARTIEEAIAFLQVAYAEWSSTGTVRFHGDAEKVRQFSRREQAGQFAELCDTVVGTNGVSPLNSRNIWE